jgi:hypothetical protein
LGKRGRPKKGETREPEPVGYERALEISKHGGKNQGDIITLKTKRGTSRAYILARLDRDGDLLDLDFRKQAVDRFRDAACVLQVTGAEKFQRVKLRGFLRRKFDADPHAACRLPLAITPLTRPMALAAAVTGSALGLRRGAVEHHTATWALIFG